MTGYRQLNGKTDIVIWSLHMKRRDFLKGAAVSSAILASEGILGQGVAAVNAESTSKPSNAARIPKREYGKTGIKL